MTSVRTGSDSDWVVRISKKARRKRRAFSLRRLPSLLTSDNKPLSTDRYQMRKSVVFRWSSLPSFFPKISFLTKHSGAVVNENLSFVLNHKKALLTQLLSFLFVLTSLPAKLLGLSRRSYLKFLLVALF